MSVKTQDVEWAMSLKNQDVERAGPTHRSDDASSMTGPGSALTELVPVVSVCRPQCASASRGSELWIREETVALEQRRRAERVGHGSFFSRGRGRPTGDFDGSECCSPTHTHTHTHTHTRPHMSHTQQRPHTPTHTHTHTHPHTHTHCSVPPDLISNERCLRAAHSAFLPRQ